MKKLLSITVCAVLAGCATRQAVELEERDDCLSGITHLSAKHARLKSVLGIDDAVLADTNRFVLGNTGYSQLIRLDKTFGGFAEARVYLDKMEDPCLRTTGGKPHRLRSVELKRHLPDDATEKDVISEWQAASDFIADILDVEPPQVRLVDLEKWRKGLGRLDPRGIRSCVTFDLAGEQGIAVGLTEPIYAMRKGKMVLASPGYLEIDLMYNRSLCYGGVRKDDGDAVVVEKEIDFGPDCRDKLSDALKKDVCGRSQRVKRKPKRK